MHPEFFHLDWILSVHSLSASRAIPTQSSLTLNFSEFKLKFREKNILQVSIPSPELKKVLNSIGVSRSVQMRINTSHFGMTFTVWGEFYMCQPVLLYFIFPCCTRRPKVS